MLHELPVQSCREAVGVAALRVEQDQASPGRFDAMAAQQRKMKTRRRRNLLWVVQIASAKATSETVALRQGR